MIANFLFFLKIIRVFKRHNILILIEQNIRYKLLFRLFTFILAPITFNKSKKITPDGIRISKALNELGPSFIKLGQLISTRPDIIGNEIAEDMAMLRDNLPPFSRSEAVSIIEEQFDKNIGDIFHNFGEPIAAASIAQVHFAEIKGWDHLQLVSMFPVYTAVAIGSMILSGILLDRLGTARLIPYFQLPMIVAFLLFAYGQSLSAALIGFIFLGLTSGATATLPNAFWAEFFGTKHLGSIKAAAAAAMVLGSAIGPAITGVLLDLNIALEFQYIAIASFFGFSSLMIWIGVSQVRGSQTA